MNKYKGKSKKKYAKSVDSQSTSTKDYSNVDNQSKSLSEDESKPLSSPIESNKDNSFEKENKTVEQNCLNKSECNNHKHCDVYKNCNHYSVNKFRNTYLWFVSITSMCVILMMSFLSYRFYQAQESIKQLQFDDHNKSKEVFASIYNKLDQNPINCDSLIRILASDTVLLNKINNYDEIQNIIIGLANKIAYKDLVDELKNDSLLINRQISTNLSTTKTLLEMQFNRIQNEYQTLAFWAGILMIVFLIFSFYSIFKTDDMIKQGKEGLVALKDEEKLILEQLREQQDKYIVDSKYRLDGVSATVKQVLNELNSKSSEFEGRLSPLELKIDTFNLLIVEASKMTNDLQQNSTRLIRFIDSENQKLSKLSQVYEEKIKKIGGQNNED